MPHISRLNEQVLDTFTCYQDDPTGFYTVNTEDGGYAPYHQVKEYTDAFYADLKVLLEEAAVNGLDITCNEEDKSFTLFGQKFYCFCIESQYSASSAIKDLRYSIVPILYKENYISNPIANIYESGTVSSGGISSGAGITNSSVKNGAIASNGYIIGTNVPPSDTYHTNHFIKAFNRFFHDYHMNYTTTRVSGEYYNAYHTTEAGATGYGNFYDFVGFNKVASLCENHTLRNTIKYKINLYYNDNYLYITYNTLHDGYVAEFPIGFFLKGTDCLNNEVLITTLSPTILATNAGLNNAYNNNVANLFTRISIWDIGTGNNLYEQDAEVIRTFNIDKYPFMNEYLGIDNTKFAKIKLQALNGLITFENLIVGEISEKYHIFTRGQYYTIDNETYYVPTDIGVDLLHPDKATYNGIFLKM
jgi:hypothetical protein